MGPRQRSVLPPQPVDEQHDEWMTTYDVARELGYTQGWVRTQIAAHRLVAQQHLSSNRRSYRIRREDFNRFVRRWMRQA